MKHDPETEAKITSLAARLLVAWWGMPQEGELADGWEADVIQNAFDFAEIFNQFCEERRSS